MMVDEQANIDQTNDEVSFAIDVKDLTQTERVIIFQLFTKLIEKSKDAYKTVSVPFEYVGRMMQMTSARVLLTITRVDPSLYRIVIEIDRKQRYVRLLLAGAPKEMLIECFATSRRQIENDRQNYGVHAANKGRPRSISHEEQFIVAGHWERISVEEIDFSRKMEEMHDHFPTQSLAAIYSFVKDLK